MRRYNFLAIGGTIESGEPDVGIDKDINHLSMSLIEISVVFRYPFGDLLRLCQKF